MARLNQSRRQQIGYVYKPQVNNNAGLAQSGRQMLMVQEQAFDQNQMSGDGFMDIVRGIMNKGKDVGKFGLKHRDSIQGALTGEVGTALRNLIPDSDETARPAYPGEIHAILKLPNGKNGVANFMGPGTQIIKRVRRGDPGRTPSDTVAERHDIDYSIAQNARDKAGQFKQVRAADNRMINSLKRIKKSRGDAGRNIQAGMKLIQAKKIGEDLGVLGKQQFSGPLEKLSASDTAVLLKEQKSLTQRGFGAGVLPGNLLRDKLLRKILRERKKKKNAKGDGFFTNLSNLLGTPDRKKDFFHHARKGKKGLLFKHAGRGKKVTGQSRSKRYEGMKTYKLNPKPLVGAGAGPITDFVKKVLPTVIKSTGMRLPTKKLVPFVMKVVAKHKTKGLKNIMGEIAKALMPILAKLKLSTLGLGGSGMKRVKKYRGGSVWSALNEKLAAGMWAAMKAYHKNAQAKKKGSGSF